MKQIVIHSLCITALLSSCLATAEVLPYLAFRSQGFNAARELVGWQTTINKGCMDSSYFSFSITPEYTRSFRSNCLAEYLFGDALINNCTGSNCSVNKCSNNSCSFIKIQGTQVANRDPQALMAENFYLPTDFDGQIKIDPVISNFLVDFNLYLGMDECHPGWYFRMHTPITHTRWALNYCETVLSSGVNNYDPGYFNNTFVGIFDDPDASDVYGLARNQLLNNFTQYAVNGDAISGISGITYEGLRNARFSTRPLTKTRLAEFTVALGWNFLACEDYHLGFQIRAAAPTGNRPNGEYLFEPIVGNGHHWELGAGLTTHFGIYKSEDECRNLSMYIDANVTHLFKSCQWRTFDLCGKPLSRYMLAMKFTDDVTNLQAREDGTFSAPTSQFANIFSPVANFSTIPVEVSYPVHADVLFKLAFTNKNFQWDIGYDFWYRSCPKFNNRCTCANAFAAGTWALKGDAFVYGFPGNSDARAITQPGIPLSATEINATIFGGTNNYPTGYAPYSWSQNAGIDNPEAAFEGGISPQALYTHEASTVGFQAVTTSLEPVLLQDYALDFDAARSRGISHKIFTHFGYMWQQCECWKPYLGIGGEVEFAQRTQDSAFDCNANSSCNLTRQAASNVTTCNSNIMNHNCQNSRSCALAALSQWGIWIKGGIAFN